MWKNTLRWIWILIFASFLWWALNWLDALGEAQAYTLGDLGPHRVVVTKLPRLVFYLYFGQLLSSWKVFEHLPILVNFNQKLNTFYLHEQFLMFIISLSFNQFPFYLRYNPWLIKSNFRTGSTEEASIASGSTTTRLLGTFQVHREGIV